MNSIFNHFEFSVSLNELNMSHYKLIWDLYHPLLILTIPIVIFYNANTTNLVISYPKIIYNELYNHWSGLTGKYLASIKNKKSIIFIQKHRVKIITNNNKFINIKLNIIFTNLFVLLFIINLFGLVPTTYCFNTWLLCTMAVSITLWVLTLSYTLYHIFYLNQTENSYIQTLEFSMVWLANFFPTGTPLWLAPVIVPIEILSYAIRPVSMGLRICGNLVAGHILMSIIWNVIVATQIHGSLILAMHGYVPLVLYMAMFILELGVSLVQAYVLTLLAITFIKEAVEIH